MIDQTLKIKMRNIIMALFIVIGMVVAFFPSRQAVLAEPEAASISLSKTAVGEGSDFATRVLGQPWDMSADPYPDFRTVFYNFDQSGFSVNNGIWTMQPAKADASITLHYRGEYLTQRVLKLGDVYPIDPNYYRILTIRMNSPRDTWARLYWFMDPWTSGGGLGVYTCSIGIQVKSGWQTYTIDLDNLPTESSCPSENQWSKLTRVVQGLAIYPSNNANSNDRFQLDWVRLTGLDMGSSQQVGINWTGVSSASKIEFFADNKCTIDNNSIKLGEVNNPGTNGTFDWGKQLLANPNLSSSNYPLPSSLQPGLYKIQARSNNGIVFPSSCPTLEIRRAPVFEWQQPSMFSGPDYATEQAGDPWGMNGSNDLDLTNGLKDINFNNEMLNATAYGDNWVHLNVPRAVDAEKYFYVTFRLKMDRYIDHMVQRFYWWQTRPEEARVTQDLRLREGWHTYSLDLRSAPMESAGNWSGDPIVFRFDFHEDPINDIPVHLDFITLTGNHYIKRGTSFPLIYQLNVPSGASVTFYADNDRNPDNGLGSQIGSRAGDTPSAEEPLTPLAAGSIYLPLLFHQYPNELNLLTGTRWDWNTGSVSAGTYYLAAVVNDGYNTVTRHSEVPVYITP